MTAAVVAPALIGSCPLRGDSFVDPAGGLVDGLEAGGRLLDRCGDRVTLRADVVDVLKDAICGACSLR